MLKENEDPFCESREVKIETAVNHRKEFNDHCVSVYKVELLGSIVPPPSHGYHFKERED